MEELNFESHSDSKSKESGHILSSVNFVRLSNFEECGKAPVLSGEIACGEQVFRRYRLKYNREVALDFWHRGFDIDEDVANEFFRLVSSPKKLFIGQLIPVADVLGPIASAVRCHVDDDIASMVSIKIDEAEVRNLNSKNVLSVSWSDSKQNKSHISLYVDSNCDGLKVDEIHISMPDDFNSNLECQKLITDTIESIQWNVLVPPPLIPGLLQTAVL